MTIAADGSIISAPRGPQGPKGIKVGRACSGDHLDSNGSLAPPPAVVISVTWRFHAFRGSEAFLDWLDLW